MNLLRALLALLAAASPVCASSPEPPPVPVRVEWTYDGIPPGMKLYELKPGDWPIWKTETVDSVSDAPVTKEVPASTLLLRPGQSRTVALFYTNLSGRTVHFFAAPHHIEPEGDSLGFKFKCLCTNHVYAVPPGHSWYRVVELKLAKGFVGDHLDIRHRLIAVGEERADDFAQGMNTKEVK
jgi:hypothetical protein